MSEFGHLGIIGNGFCLDAWGAGPFVIIASGKSFRFEDSDRLGPALVKLNGDLLSNPYPPERSPFWRAHRIWVRQGRRTKDNGVACVWDEPKPTLLRRIDSRNALVVEHGEEDGDNIFVE